jgi:Legionella pneumophila major outer membrane protein precursor
MARVNSHRAAVRLAIALVCFLPSVAVPEAALAQTAAAQAPAVTPVQQPMWVGQTPMYQVGPDGAVHLDQPMMAPGQPYTGQGQPMQSFMQPLAAPPMATPYPPQQYVTPQPWGAQAVQPQPTWGAPLLSGSTLMGGPIPPSYIHRHAVFGEFLYMRPRDADVAYALPIDGPVAPVLGNEVPVGPVALIDPDYDAAFRIGGSLALDKGSSIAGQYTRLRSESEDSVTVVAPTVLRSLVAHPLGANAASDTLDASAALDIEMDLIDIDFRSLMFGCEGNCAYAINYLIGAEFATLDQRFESSFITLGTTTVNSDIEFEGIGMRFGLQGERFWPHSGVFVYGTGVSNFLFGEFDATYFQTNSFNGVEAGTSWTAGRIVPVLDFEVGAGWLVLNRHLRLSGGYRVSTWLNVVKTDEWINAVQANDFTNMDGTMTFDGLVARAEWMF